MGVVVHKGLGVRCAVETDDIRCIVPAKFHASWIGDNGYAAVCAGHFGPVLLACWKDLEQWHTMQPDCGMPGTGWYIKENRCMLWGGPA